MTPAQEYQQLLAELAQKTRALAALLADTLQCRPGCASCCIPFAVLPIEAAAMRAALTALPMDRKDRIYSQSKTESTHCPLLVDQLCAIYGARPIICRTQGLALAYVDEERQAIEISACPVNFGDDFAFREEHLLFMDRINARLFALNVEYCRAEGLPADKRVAIPDIARKAIAESA
ncbi:YkgJ family cysteine cluster protein [Thiovibrio sp. JS02]